MLMIPLPFVIALAALVLLLREQRSADDRGSNRWFMAFLGLFVFQEILIGLRFGHGLDWLREIQPFSAALIPPLAYLAFVRPHWSWRLLIHTLPVFCVIITLQIVLGFSDIVLAINNFTYAALLLRLGLQGGDALGWVEFRRMKEVMLLLWLAIGVLLVSGIADVIIFQDYFSTRGANTGNIASWVTVIGMFVTAIVFFVYRYLTAANKKPDSVETGKSAEVFKALGLLMKTEKLHLDTEINLNRIARRMVLPAREVSRAINSCTGNSVSHYINALRIEEACRLLEETDQPVIQIVFAAGFNTKSNFNREFSRLKKKSPTEWRNARS
ncbi:MAG: AraC family transcriptional regulator [Sneathiella sp.]